MLKICNNFSYCTFALPLDWYKLNFSKTDRNGAADMITTLNDLIFGLNLVKTHLNMSGE